MKNNVEKGDIMRRLRARRNIYRCGGTWLQPFLAAVPWLNAILLGFMLFMVHGKISVAPGVLFDLPREPLREGSVVSLTAMMIPVGSDTRPGGVDTLVFFDDDRFLIGDASQKDALSERVRESASRKYQTGDLLLMTDKRVSHGEVMDFVNLAREAGIKRVNVALKPE